MIVNNKIFCIYQNCNEEISWFFSLVGITLMKCEMVHNKKKSLSRSGQQRMTLSNMWKLALSNMLSVPLLFWEALLHYLLQSFNISFCCGVVVVIVTTYEGSPTCRCAKIMTMGFSRFHNTEGHRRLGFHEFLYYKLLQSYYQ